MPTYTYPLYMVGKVTGNVVKFTGLHSGVYITHHSGNWNGTESRHFLEHTDRKVWDPYTDDPSKIDPSYKKPPFPVKADIKWYFMTVPDWAILTWPSHMEGLINTRVYSSIYYDFYKNFYENSLDFSIEVGLKDYDPHSAISKEYNDALKNHDIVKPYWKNPDDGINDWEPVLGNDIGIFRPGNMYKLKYFDVSFVKVLDWSRKLDKNDKYVNQHVICEFSAYADFTLNAIEPLIAVFGGKFYSPLERYDYCRLHSTTVIEPEWLVERKISPPYHK